MNDENQNGMRSSRTFADKLLEAWHTSKETLWLGALAGSGFQLLLTLFSIGRPFFTSWLTWAVVTLLQFGLLLARRRWPLYALAGQSVILALGETPAGTGTYSWVPFLICVASLVLRDRRRNVLIGVGMASASALLSAGFHSARGPQSEILVPVLSILGTAILLAVCARGRMNSLAERDRRLSAEQRERDAAARQRKAESVSRVATNLHDSVGHNLTGIIALVEGISNQSGNEQVDEVVDLVNELARDALGETRTAIRAIKSAGTEEHGLPQPNEDSQTWQDISQLLDNVRSTGLAIAVSEVGKRPEDRSVQDTLYRSVREGLTNVMKHAQCATVVDITFVFSPRAVEVTLTDNGNRASPFNVPGVGLDGLAERVQQAGGTFDAGWSQNGWRLRATLPLQSADLE